MTLSLIARRKGRLDVEDWRAVEGFEAIHHDAGALDANDGRAVEADGVRTVR